MKVFSTFLFVLLFTLNADAQFKKSSFLIEEPAEISKQCTKQLSEERFNITFRPNPVAIGEFTGMNIPIESEKITVRVLDIFFNQIQLWNVSDPHQFRMSLNEPGIYFIDVVVYLPERVLRRSTKLFVVR